MAAAVTVEGIPVGSIACEVLVLGGLDFSVVQEVFGQTTWTDNKKTKSGLGKRRRSGHGGVVGGGRKGRVGNIGATGARVNTW